MHFDGDRDLDWTKTLYIIVIMQAILVGMYAVNLYFLRELV